MDSQVATITWAAQGGKTVSPGDKGVGVRMVKEQTKNCLSSEIEELCNKKQVSERSCIVKLDPQFDKTKRLLVVGGHLQFAQIPEEEKHQIIIPHNDPVIEKLIMHVHVKASH